MKSHMLSYSAVSLRRRQLGDNYAEEITLLVAENIQNSDLVRVAKNPIWFTVLRVLVRLLLVTVTEASIQMTQS